MNNDFTKRLEVLENEITALKTAKDKSSNLIQTIEYPVEIELEIFRNSYEFLESTMVLVNTTSRSEGQPLVSLYYNGDDDKRIFEFYRFIKNPLREHEHEMGFVVSIAMFASEDGSIGPSDRKKIPVPLKIVATGPVQITVEEFEL